MPLYVLIEYCLIFENDIVPFIANKLIVLSEKLIKNLTIGRRKEQINYVLFSYRFIIFLIYSMMRFISSNDCCKLSSKFLYHEYSVYLRYWFWIPDDCGWLHLIIRIPVYTVRHVNCINKFLLNSWGRSRTYKIFISFVLSNYISQVTSKLK